MRKAEEIEPLLAGGGMVEDVAIPIMISSRVMKASKLARRTYQVASAWEQLWTTEKKLESKRFTGMRSAHKATFAGTAGDRGSGYHRTRRIPKGRGGVVSFNVSA